MISPPSKPGGPLKTSLRIAALVSAQSFTLAVVASSVSAQAATRLERFSVSADDGHSLTVWARHPAARQRGSILLLHGRTWSSLPNFDLHVPHQNASLMDALGDAGYAVYALDQRGYGATPRDSSGWLTPDRAAHDASEVLAWIKKREATRDHGRAPALFGYSRGSLTALMTAQKYGDGVGALILYGLPLRPEFYSSLGRDSTAPRRAPTTLDAAGTDFTIPGSPSPEVKAAYQRAAVAADPVRVDWRDEREFGALDARAIKVPVLLITGERDPNVTAADAEFFGHLASVDRQWVVFAAADHVAHLERPRDFVYAITAFLSGPRQ